MRWLRVVSASELHVAPIPPIGQSASITEEGVLDTVS